MFSPGETVSHQFIIPFVVSEVAKVIVSYKQDGDIVFEKTITSGFEQGETQAETKFIIAFSQTESLMFHPEKPLKIQINVITTYGARATSKEIKSNNSAQYHREVI